MLRIALVCLALCGLVVLIWMHMLTCVDVASSCICKFFYVGWVGINDLVGVFF